MKAPDGYVTMKEAAQALGLTVGHVGHLVMRGTFEVLRVQEGRRRRIYISRESLTREVRGRTGRPRPPWRRTQEPQRATFPRPKRLWFL